MIDGQFTITLIICVAAGIAFAGLAVHLSTTQGNTIEAVQKAIGAGQCPPLQIELPGGYRLSAGVPVVALYAIAAICGFVLPGWFIYVTHVPPSKPVTVTGSFDRPVHHIAFENPQDNSFGTGFQISFDPRQSAQDLVLDAAPEFGSVSITTEYHESSRSVAVYDNGSRLGEWSVDSDGYVHIPQDTHVSLVGLGDVKNLPLEPAHKAVSLAKH